MGPACAMQIACPGKALRYVPLVRGILRIAALTQFPGDYHQVPERANLHPEPVDKSGKRSALEGRDFAVLLSGKPNSSRSSSVSQLSRAVM